MALAGDDEGRMFLGTDNKVQRRRETQAGIQDNPQRPAGSQTGKTYVEAWIIGNCRAGADKNGIVLGTDEMSPLARLRAGDPAALSGGQGDFPVQGRRQLQGDTGAGLQTVKDESAIQRFCLFPEQSYLNLNTRCSKSRDAPPTHAWIRIFAGNDTAPDASSNECVCAGAGYALMRAGFKTDEGCRAPGRVTGATKRFRLRMGTTTRLGPAAPHDPTLMNKDAADCRIGCGSPQPSPGQEQSRAHVSAIARVHRAAPRTSSGLFGFAPQLADEFAEVAGLPEVAVDGSEADVGDLIQGGEGVHDHLADHFRRYLRVAGTFQPADDSIDDPLEPLLVDGSLLQGNLHRSQELVSVEGLAL